MRFLFLPERWEEIIFLAMEVRFFSHCRVSSSVRSSSRRDISLSSSGFFSPMRLAVSL